MKAPISKRVRQILSDARTARELVKQLIMSLRTNQPAEIWIGNDRYALVRVTGQRSIV
ncbi:hypothetical protein [Spirosoma rigui]|uniref:hypothetical protein n=1 Tax=Spirosoma rigui TaxID=564064 RepID=UPI0012D3643C|nr:hypothetical protein [Spirosoma rigui]